MNRRLHKHFGAVLVIMILLIMTVSMNGQQFNAGFFGGLNVSQVSGDTYKGFNKLGFTAGFFVNSPIEQHFYWQAEIKYGTRGVYEGPSEGDASLYKSSYHIVELPLSINYLFDEKIMLELGISPEVLITVRYWDENGLLAESSYPDNRRFGLSVFAGIGYWFNDRMMVGLRYTNSAVPFRDPEEWNNSQYRGYFHNVISLTLGFKFKPK
ncbi:MAG: PorT family protein [Bacteroidales bacterium]|nr:PorT family protein [Bacteroidales bacterium]